MKLALKEAGSMRSPVDSLVEEYFHTRNKTLSSLLETCRVVFRAKTELKRVTFKTFSQKVGLTSDGSVSKMVGIGRRYDQFKRHEESLPCAWTTVYKLTKIDEDTVDRLIESEVIHPAVTAADLAPYLPVVKSEPSGRVPTSISIGFEKGLDSETIQTIRSLLDQLKKCGCTFKEDKAAEVLEMV